MNQQKQRIFAQFRISVMQLIFYWSLMNNPSFAALCDEYIHVRYEPSLNELYVENSGDCTLEEIAAMPSVKNSSGLLRIENGNADIFLLRAEFRVTNGSILRIYGPQAGGKVGQFRLLSNDPSPANGNSKKEFVFVSADSGTIDIIATEVLSWDELKNSPDTTPSNQSDTTSVRAYINAISRQDPDTGEINESTLNVRDSLIHHLGYQGSQAYGLSWKTILKQEQSLDLLDELDVFGEVTGNTIHHLHYGFYSYGGLNMNISDNEFYQNNVYGIDPHDDSDFLIIRGNHVHDNGKHGIICSKRCNNIEIIDNISSNNGAHGIMLHEIVDHSLVIGNTANNNGDTGIAIYESNHNIIRNNTVEGNKTGIRLSMGASFNLIENNISRNNTGNEIRIYHGSNSPTRINNDGGGLCDGLPRSNTFKNNQISGNSGSLPIRLSDADKNLFLDNKVNPPQVKISSGRNNMFVNNEFSETPTFILDASGDTTRPSLVYLAGENGFTLDERAASQGIILGN